MNGLQVFDLQKPPHPSPSGGGSSNGLDYRETLDETGGAEAPPFEPPKTGGENDEAADSAKRLRLSSQCLHESPISAISFFDVDLRGSIAAGIAADQTGVDWLLNVQIEGQA